MACECAPNADLLARLTDIVQQLRDATTGENWPIDWAGFDSCLARAAAATQAENLADAAREYLRAILVMMSQLRQIRLPRAVETNSRELTAPGMCVDFRFPSGSC